MVDGHGRADAAGETGNSASSAQGWQRRWTKHGGQTTSSRSLGDWSCLVQDQWLAGLMVEGLARIAANYTMLQQSVPWYS